MNDVQHRVPAQSAARVCARALNFRMHTSTASFIIPPDVVVCRITCRRSGRMHTSAARVCAQGSTRYCTRAARGAGTQFLSMRALCSGQPWAKKVRGSTGDDDAQARPGPLGGAGRGALILPGGARRGALVSALQRPCQL